MRTIPALLDAMISSRRHTRSRCAHLILRDGTIIGITDHDHALESDYLAGSGEPTIYHANTGVMPGDISLATGLDTDNSEIAGPLSDLISRTAVLGKKFNRAQVYIFDIDWTQPHAGIIPMMYGNIADGMIEGGQFKFEVRNLFDRYNQTIGRVLAPYCTADYGDTQCGVVRAEYPTTITGVVDDFNFSADLDGAHPNDFFNLGTVEFTSGALAGIEEIEVFDYVGATTTIQLFVPLPETPQIGDAIILRKGCSKLKSSDDVTLPTCLTNANVIRFRGFDRVPGTDVYIRVPTPGSGGA